MCLSVCPAVQIRVHALGMSIYARNFLSPSPAWCTHAVCVQRSDIEHGQMHAIEYGDKDTRAYLYSKFHVALCIALGGCLKKKPQLIPTATRIECLEHS